MLLIFVTYKICVYFVCTVSQTQVYPTHSNRWNGLDKQTVGATSLDVVKTRLETIKNTRMGFFVD